MPASSPLTQAERAIETQQSRLAADFGYRAVLAAEIEFYLHGSASIALDDFWQRVRVVCGQGGIELFNIEKEKGAEQHELSLQPSTDAVKIARDLTFLKTTLNNLAVMHHMQADFTAKPLDSEPGSGLHIHVHLEHDGQPVFCKKDDKISDALRFSLGGLVAWLPDCMPIFAPQESSYRRFAPGGNAPVTVSWGANNRTVAIRLPEAPHESKRIEHRVAGADADPAAGIAVILAAMHAGLSQRLDPGAQIYGDAALPMYGLPRLPATLEEATARMQANPQIKELFCLI